jgi:hypothetical protein
MFKKYFFFVFFLIAISFADHDAVAKGIDKVQFSNLVVEKFNLSETDTFLFDILPNDNDYYAISSMGYAFPGIMFDGKQWYSKKEEVLTKEMAVNSLMRTIKIPLFDQECYVNGVINYSPYICSSIRYLILNSDDLRNLEKEITNKEAIFLLNKFHNFFEKTDLQDKFNYKFFNKEARFVLNSRGTESKNQSYFPDGPLQSALSGSVAVPENSKFHQYQGILGSVDLYSNNVNAVGVWGAAKSFIDKGRVWGGFLSANSFKEGNDSQVIGLEIDTINYAKNGEFPNQSKIGLQIVGIGKKNNTAGIEILSDNVAKWYNGILIEENAITENGTILGVAQKSTMKTGIDLSNSHFTDSAIRIKNGEYLRFDSEENKQNPALIYSSMDNPSKLVIRAGVGGIEIRDNSEKKILFSSNDGTILFSNLTNIIFLFCNVFILVLNYLIYKNKKKRSYVNSPLFK